MTLLDIIARSLTRAERQAHNSHQPYGWDVKVIEGALMLEADPDTGLMRIRDGLQDERDHLDELSRMTWDEIKRRK